MTLESIPLFAMLKAKLGYDHRREGVIAENVANSETPGYAPRDLKSFSFQAALDDGGVGLSQTRAGHLAGRPAAAGALRLQAGPDSETALGGGQVVLEEQMMKMSDARADYDAAIGFYQQSLTLLRTAARAPGK